MRCPVPGEGPAVGRRRACLSAGCLRRAAHLQPSAGCALPAPRRGANKRGVAHRCGGAGPAAGRCPCLGSAEAAPSAGSPAPRPCWRRLGGGRGGGAAVPRGGGAGGVGGAGTFSERSPPLAAPPRRAARDRRGRSGRGAGAAAGRGRSGAAGPGAGGGGMEARRPRPWGKYGRQYWAAPGCAPSWLLQGGEGGGRGGESGFCGEKNRAGRKGRCRRKGGRAASEETGGCQPGRPRHRHKAAALRAEASGWLLPGGGGCGPALSVPSGGCTGSRAAGG